MHDPNPDSLIDKEKYYVLKQQYNLENLIPYKGTHFLLDPSARIDIRGRLRLNTNCFQENGRVTNLRMDASSQLKVSGNFDIYYGGDIICFTGSSLELGNGFCNSNLILRCTEKIVIGEGVAISHNVTIMDSDAHDILDEKHQKTQPVKIGNHVWIGTGAKILKGVTIGDGTIVAAGAVVVNDIPDGCMVAGMPAKVIKRGVRWK